MKSCGIDNTIDSIRDKLKKNNKKKQKGNRTGRVQTYKYCEWVNECECAVGNICHEAVWI